MDTELLKGTLSLLILSLLGRKAMYGYEIAATVHRDRSMRCSCASCVICAGVSRAASKLTSNTRRRARDSGGSRDS